MNRLLPLLGFIVLAFQINAQVVINEIMYNPPESGNDSLEYVEIYNPGLIEVDLTDFTLGGADFTFPSHILAAGSYVVVAINSEALMNQFGVDAFQWTSGALKNGGEIVSISDNMGNLIDEVEYMTAGGWPSSAEGTAGEGASIELCDPEMDNNVASNWNASSTSTGIEINGKDLRGTPMAANSPCGPPAPDYIVQTEGFTFNPADITIGVGETVQWQNTGGTHNVNGSTDTYPANPEGFKSGDPSGDLWMFQHTFTIAGVYDYQCDPHAGFGMTGTVTVISDVTPTNYPLRTIAEVVGLDTNGEGDSLGIKCELIGLVYGVNLRPSGLTFVLIDDTNEGITIFSDAGDLGYTVTEGDEVSVKGVITQFSGLLELEPDSLNVLSGGNSLFAPTDVTALGENTESQLVRLMNMQVVNSDDWTGDGSSFNVTLTDGSNESVMRIDSDVDLANMMLPGTLINVTGLGGQYDTSSPYDEGYQLLPRYAADIDVISAVEILDAAALNIYPNPCTEKLIIETEYEIQGFRIINEMGASIVAQRGNTKVIQVSDLAPGIYVLEITSTEGSVGSQRFVKQ